MFDKYLTRVNICSYRCLKEISVVCLMIATKVVSTYCYYNDYYYIGIIISGERDVLNINATKILRPFNNTPCDYQYNKRNIILLCNTIKK